MIMHTDLQQQRAMDLHQMFHVNASKNHAWIQYLIPAPSWVPENVNVGTPAAETSEVIINPLSSVVIVL